VTVGAVSIVATTESLADGMVESLRADSVFAHPPSATNVAASMSEAVLICMMILSRRTPDMRVMSICVVCL
jgi:hypothetical protein